MDHRGVGISAVSAFVAFRGPVEYLANRLHFSRRAHLVWLCSLSPSRLVRCRVEGRVSLSMRLRAAEARSKVKELELAKWRKLGPALARLREVLATGAA